MCVKNSNSDTIDLFFRVLFTTLHAIIVPQPGTVCCLILHQSSAIIQTKDTWTSSKRGSIDIFQRNHRIESIWREAKLLSSVSDCLDCGDIFECGGDQHLDNTHGERRSCKVLSSKASSDQSFQSSEIDLTLHHCFPLSERLTNHQCRTARRSVHNLKTLRWPQ
jgi:hypothetical protein